MSDPQPPNRRQQPAESQHKEAAASRETSRPADSAPVVAGQFTNLPATFGRYHVEKLLGRGAMGAVYLARDTKLGRPVALKIPKVAASGSKRLLARLETEAKAAAQLDHPSLCKVHDAGEINGQCFIAMQYIEGETLKTQLEAQNKTVAESISLIVQLAEGLSEAHVLGIIHRDLKPENIMINRKGTPVIMDFGLAKFSTINSNAVATQAGTILGSPAYMSPEQANGNTKEIDQRSDIYSLGTIFYELLTGHWPFNGSAMQILGQKTLQEPASPLTLKPDLPPQLASICHKMVAKNNVERYQTLAEVIADLKRIDLNLALPVPSEVSLDAFPVISISDPADERRGSITTRKKAKPAPEVRQPSVAGATLPQRLKAWWNGRTPLVQRTTLGGAAAALIVLGIIVLFPTPHGTIQIDIEDPSLSARFDGNMVTFDNAGTPIRVTSTAKRTLEVLQNGIAIDAATKELTIRRGEQRIVTLKLLGDDVVLDGKRIAKKTTAKAKAAEPGWQGWPADAPPPAIAPFDAAEAKARQAAWGKYLGTKVLEWNSVGMGLVLIPPGTFVMGSPAGEVGRSTNEDQTTVTLTQPIYVGKTEVTQGQWMATMASQPWKDGFDVKEGANYPATFVSWEDANAFCEKLSSLEGVTYRLLSDAEWEYACRAGTTSRFSFGDNESQLGRYEWYRENAFDIKEEFAHQVAMKVPNSFGLHDMHGNVSEFCQDLSVEKLPGGTDPLVTSGGVRRITRGGTWWRDENSVYRSSTRRDAAPDFPISTAGFRVARVVPSTQRKVGLEPGVIASAPISNNGPPQNELPPLVSTRWNGWPTDAPPPAIAPFDAVQAKAHQVAWAKYLGVKVVEQNSVGMDMVLVPPGSFKMGESVHASNVQVSVMLTKPISVAMTEVTQAQWSAIMGTQPWKGQANINEGTDYAATYVNWTDAEAYCTKLSSTEGATYRLLTEAEWEFACRAGTVTLYSFGDDMSLLGEHAWFNENASKVKAEYAHLVGLKTPNPFGLKDLHGNVWEWCRDSYEKNIPGGENPLVSSGDSNQVIRGGCWFHHGGNCRSACRGSTPINSRYSFLGFRVARVLSSTELDGKHGPSGSASKNFEKRAGPLMEKNGLALIPAQKSSRFPIVHYAEPPNSPQKKDKPAVVVACDSDPQITTDQPCHDSLRLLTASGVTIWEHNGLNICPTIGGTHQIAIDLQRNRIYVNEMATHRIVAFDMQGNRRWHLEQVRASAVALDEKTGNIWCCRGKDLSEGETVAFDPQGVEVAAYSSHGFDMIYDRYTDGFWLAGKSVTKLDRNGISQFQKSIAAWACLSVSVNTNNGRVWIVERSTPNITTSKNRLWSLNSDGTVHREWDFGKLYLFSVSCVPKSGDAWVSFSGSGGIRRVSPGGQMGELLPLKVTQLSVSPTTSEIWTATSEAVLKLNANGKVLLTSPLAKPCGSVWLQAF